MSMKILHRGTNSSVLALDATCFTKQNFVEGTTKNDTINIKTPVGVLSGSVAAFSADNTVVPANGTNIPAGIFFFDAAASYLQNVPAEASNKITVVMQMPVYTVDVYETYTAAGVAITYAVGDKLYASVNGLLTNVESTEGTVLGIVSKAPTTSNPVMTVYGRI